MPVGVAERLARRRAGRRPCRRPALIQAGQRRGDLQVELVALDVERIGTGGLELGPARRREAGDGAGSIVRRPPHAPVGTVGTHRPRPSRRRP